MKIVDWYASDVTWFLKYANSSAKTYYLFTLTYTNVKNDDWSVLVWNSQFEEWDRFFENRNFDFQQVVDCLLNFSFDCFLFIFSCFVFVVESLFYRVFFLVYRKLNQWWVKRFFRSVQSLIWCIAYISVSKYRAQIAVIFDDFRLFNWSNYANFS